MNEQELMQQDAINVMKKLIANSYQAYQVGGCVRDKLMNRKCHDYDIATNAKPEEVMSIFGEDAIPTGIDYGTITVKCSNSLVEVTTYRKDSKHTDGRRPKSVTFSDKIEEDLSRRDFTMNAIAIDIDGKIVDPYFGQRDIADKTIRAVGDANLRIKEDALRMMRAIRFVTQLGFGPEFYLWVAIRKNYKLINKVSIERITDELNKILLSTRPDSGIRLLRSSGILDIIIPELAACYLFDQNSQFHHKDVFEHILMAVKNTPQELETRLSAMLHDIAKPNTYTEDEDGHGHFYQHHVKGSDMAKEILTRLKYSNEIISNVTILVKEHMSRYPFLRTSNIKKLINRIGIDNVDKLIALQKADIMASRPPHDFSLIDELDKTIKDILSKDEPISLKHLVINGNHLIEWGCKPGPVMKTILNNMLDMVIENPDKNNTQDLKQYYNSFMEEQHNGSN